MKILQYVPQALRLGNVFGLVNGFVYQAEQPIDNAIVKADGHYVILCRSHELDKKLLLELFGNNQSLVKRPVTLSSRNYIESLGFTVDGSVVMTPEEINPRNERGREQEKAHLPYYGCNQIHPQVARDPSPGPQVGTIAVPHYGLKHYLISLLLGLLGVLMTGVSTWYLLGHPSLVLDSTMALISVTYLGAVGSILCLASLIFTLRGIVRPFSSTIIWFEC